MDGAGQAQQSLQRLFIRWQVYPAFAHLFMPFVPTTSAEVLRRMNATRQKCLLPLPAAVRMGRKLQGGLAVSKGTLCSPRLQTSNRVGHIASDIVAANQRATKETLERFWPCHQIQAGPKPLGHKITLSKSPAQKFQYYRCD